MKLSSTYPPDPSRKQDMEFLEVPLIDDDFFKLLIRLLVDLFSLFALIRFAFLVQEKKRDYLFPLVLMNLMVFFLCFTLKKLELGLGMALGLFAVFGILRYRTETIRIREMTYLFVVVGLAVINALSNKKTSYAELFFSNLMILAAAIVFERMQFAMKHPVPKRQDSATEGNRAS